MRPRFLLAFPVLLAACSCPDPGGAGGGVSTTGPAVDPCPLASCPEGTGCDADDECAAKLPGNYCDMMSPCAEAVACRAGRCHITRIQGETCDRDAMCADPLACVGGVCAVVLPDAGVTPGGLGG